MIATIPVRTDPLGVAYDPGDGRVYVTNEGSNPTYSGTVSIIATSQNPHHTTITSAVDDNNNHVQNGSSTLSTSITFNVRANPGVNSITGFQCSLDNAPSFSSCDTPTTNNAGAISFNNLAAEQQHTVKIVAVDSQGNVDPNPAIFSWFVTQQLPSTNSNNTTVANGGFIANGGFGGSGDTTIAQGSNGGYGGEVATEVQILIDHNSDNDDDGGGAGSN